MFKKRKNKKGFTLIELLVVVLIIGLLSAIAIPFYFKAMEKTRATEALSMLGSIARAEDRIKFASENQEYTDQLGVLDINPAVYSQQDESSFDSQYFDFTLGMEKAQAKRKPTSSEDYTLYIDYATAKLTCSNRNGSGMCARLGIEEVEESDVGGNQAEANWEDCNGALDASSSIWAGNESSYSTCKVKYENNQQTFYVCMSHAPICLQETLDSQNEMVYNSSAWCNSFDETTGMCQEYRGDAFYAILENDGRRETDYECSGFNGTTCESGNYDSMRIREDDENGNSIYDADCYNFTAEGDCLFYSFEYINTNNGDSLIVYRDLNSNNEVVVMDAYLDYHDENGDPHQCSGANVDVENRVCLN